MIHDHSNSHCVMRVLEGELQETRYRPPATPENFDGHLQILQSVRLDPSHEPPGLYIHDSIGWHRMGNPSASRKCVSLHLYSPPIVTCRGVSESGRLQSFKQASLYSVKGKRVVPTD